MSANVEPVRKKRRKCSGSVLEPSADGLQTDDSTQKEMGMETGIMMCLESSEGYASVEDFQSTNMSSEEQLSMLELALDSNATTSKTKSKVSEKDLGKHTKSCKTLGVGSISGVLGLTRFWQESSKEKYNACVLPTKTDFAASHSISSRHFASSTEQKSKWQTMTIHRRRSLNWPKTSFQSSQFLERVCTENEVQDRGGGLRKRKKPLQGKMRCMRMRIRFSNVLQRDYMKEWMASAQKIYNKTVELIPERGRIPEAQIRKQLLTDHVPEHWERDVPRRVRDAALAEAVKNAKLCRRKGGHLKFRDSKRDLTQTIAIESTGNGGCVRSAKDVGKFVALTISPRTRLGQQGPLYVRKGCRLASLLLEDNGFKFGAKIQRNKRAGAFYLYVSYEKKQLRDPDPCFKQKRVVALDPGIKTVQTFYAPDGTHGTFLDGYENYVEQKHQKLKKLRDRIKSIRECEEFKCRRRSRGVRSIRSKQRDVYWKLACWMDNMHYFMINRLFEEWDIIVFPVLDVRRIIRKRGRCYDSATALKLSCISHYRLRNRCKDRAEIMEGKYVMETGEPGTSRTCGHCGHWHEGLGGARVFRCPRCSIEIDRDVNGARNNLLATLDV